MPRGYAWRSKGESWTLSFSSVVIGLGKNGHQLAGVDQSGHRCSAAFMTAFRRCLQLAPRPKLGRKPDFEEDQRGARPHATPSPFSMPFMQAGAVLMRFAVGGVCGKGITFITCWEFGRETRRIPPFLMLGV